MNVTIYQIDHKRDVNNAMFMSFEKLEHFLGSTKIDSSIYDKIYESEMDEVSLEIIYTKFNIERPSDFKGHSLSVSDVVQVTGSKKIADGFYFCDSIGFKKIDFDNTKCPVSERFNYPKEKLKVLFVEPGIYPKAIHIDDSLEAIKKLVGGEIESYMPYSDEVAIVCNAEAKLNNLPLNRAVYSEAKEIDMSYGELKNKFRECERNGEKHLTGYIVFTEDSFDKKYTLEERTYVVSSSNKAFIPNMGGYSIFASSLDGSDMYARIEKYMADEYGGKDGWKIERCYIKDESDRKLLDIIAGNFFICLTPAASEEFESLPADLMRKYEREFKMPEKFPIVNGEITPEKYKPKAKGIAR